MHSQKKFQFNRLAPLASHTVARQLRTTLLVITAMVGTAVTSGCSGEKNSLQTVTLPSLEDASLWETFDAVRIKMFNAAQTKRAATRYGLGK